MYILPCIYKRGNVKKFVKEDGGLTSNLRKRLKKITFLAVMSAKGENMLGFYYIVSIKLIYAFCSNTNVLGLGPKRIWLFCA